MTCRTVLETCSIWLWDEMVIFADIEALLKGLGAKVLQREGSRVKVELQGEQWRAHRPHPGKEAKRYQVEEVRELLERLGIHP